MNGPHLAPRLLLITSAQTPRPTKFATPLRPFLAVNHARLPCRFVVRVRGRGNEGRCGRPKMVGMAANGAGRRARRRPAGPIARVATFVAVGFGGGGDRAARRSAFTVNATQRQPAATASSMPHCKRRSVNFMPLFGDAERFDPGQLASSNAAPASPTCVSTPTCPPIAAAKCNRCRTRRDASSAGSAGRPTARSFAPWISCGISPARLASRSRSAQFSRCGRRDGSALRWRAASRSSTS